MMTIEASLSWLLNLKPLSLKKFAPGAVTKTAVPVLFVTTVLEVPAPVVGAAVEVPIMLIAFDPTLSALFHVTVPAGTLIVSPLTAILTFAWMSATFADAAV
jgi:hypothetical protein